MIISQIYWKGKDFGQIGDIEKLPYLHQVTKEYFYVYPSVPDQDCKLVQVSDCYGYRLRLRKFVSKMGFELGFLGQQVGVVPTEPPLLF